MKTTKRAALTLMAILALSACSQNEKYDESAALGANAANGAIVPGSANDPASPAYFQASVGDRVLFLVDQSTLTDEARLVLNGQAQWLSTNSDYQAVIEGLSLIHI